MAIDITYRTIGRTRAIEPGCPLLTAFKLHNIPVSYSCEAATCGTCVVRIDSGLELLSPMSPEEASTLRAHGFGGPEEPQYRLACQALLRGHGALTVHNKV